MTALKQWRCSNGERQAIRSEEDYEEALARVADLLDELSGPDGQIDDPITSAG